MGSCQTVFKYITKEFQIMLKLILISSLVPYTIGGLLLTYWLKDFILDRFKQPVSVLLSFPVFLFHVFCWPVVMAAIIFQIIKNSRMKASEPQPSVFFADRIENINPTVPATDRGTHKNRS